MSATYTRLLGLLESRLAEKRKKNSAKEREKEWRRKSEKKFLYAVARIQCLSRARTRATLTRLRNGVDRWQRTLTIWKRRRKMLVGIRPVRTIVCQTRMCSVCRQWGFWSHVRASNEPEDEIFCIPSCRACTPIAIRRDACDFFSVRSVLLVFLARLEFILHFFYDSRRNRNAH